MGGEKAKILLLAVQTQDMDEMYEEIGLCFIASYLREKGYDVTMAMQRYETIDYKEIQALAPDVVAMSLYDVSKEIVFNVSEQLKRQLPNLFICVGGALPTYSHEELIRETSFVDCILRGEGELTMYEVVSKLEEGETLAGVKGITYRQGDQIVVNDAREPIEDLNQMPWPARDFLQQNNLKVALLSTSRGCLGNCHFCASKALWGDWRGRDPENIVDEMEYIAKEYGMQFFNFIDHSFEDPNDGGARLRKIAEEIVRRDLKISYFADFRAEFHRKADTELMDLLKRSGLCGVCIGIESAHEPDLRLYGKRARIEDNHQVTELFQSYGINIKPGFINFNPYSTFEALHKNIDYLEKSRFLVYLDPFLRRYMMCKDTELYRRVVKDGLLKEGEFHELGYHFVNPDIGELANYVHDYIWKTDPVIIEAVSRISTYAGADYFLNVKSHIKRKIDEDSREACHKYYRDFDEKYTAILEDLNSSIARWYRKLLALAEEGWDREIAEQISQENLNSDYIRGIADRFAKTINRFYLNLLRVDSAYEKHMVRFY